MENRKKSSFDAGRRTVLKSGVALLPYVVPAVLSFTARRADAIPLSPEERSGGFGPIGTGGPGAGGLR